MPWTVTTVATADALLLAGSKVDTLVTALTMVKDPLPEGTTREVVDEAIRKLGQVSDMVTHEGNQLHRLGDPE
jgi:hypothetical protein